MTLDHEPDYPTIVVSEIQPRLPEGVESKTCDDVRDLNVECCETGHNSYPQGHRKTGQRWSRQNRSNGSGAGARVVLPRRFLWRHVCFRVPSRWTSSNTWSG